VAVGSVSDATAMNPFIVGWNTGTWELEAAPVTSSSGSSWLQSVSCPSAGDCVAVGITQAQVARRVPLAIRTVSDLESEDPEPTTIEEPMPKLTAAQESSAIELLEEDPSFQAAIGTLEYELAAIGPWTESNEEGEQMLIGVYIAVSLVEPETWSERTWLDTEYEMESDGEFPGSYEEGSIEAAGEDILALEARLDTEVDSEDEIVDAEVVELMPMPLDPLAPEIDAGTIEIDPDSVEYDEAGQGY
jgi:hypothetical protein